MGKMPKKITSFELAKDVGNGW